MRYERPGGRPLSPSSTRYVTYVRTYSAVPELLDDERLGGIPSFWRPTFLFLPVCPARSSQPCFFRFVSWPRSRSNFYVCSKAPIVGVREEKKKKKQRAASWSGRNLAGSARKGVDDDKEHHPWQPSSSPSLTLPVSLSLRVLALEFVPLARAAPPQVRPCQASICLRVSEP